MTALATLLCACEPIAALKPWPGRRADSARWSAAAQALGRGEGEFFGLWSDGQTVYMAVRPSERSDAVTVLTIAAAGGRYPSVGAHLPAAQRLERTLRDLYGLTPEGLEDARPWIDHCMWTLRHPGRDPTPHAPAPTPYPFLPVRGEGLHQIAVGPIHAGVIEPGHFRFTANGETIVRLEERFGYAHRGVELALAGAPLARATRVAARVCGDSTVAYGWAFARAVEAATGAEPPARALWIRGLMAEMERIANHLGDIGAICNDAAFALLHAHCAVLRERTLRVCATAFGHRLMMDGIIPGGLAHDLSGDGAAALDDLVTEIEDKTPALWRVYDETASLQDRTVGTGVLSPVLARRFAAGGFVGRASGRRFDARRVFAYPPYDRLPLVVAGLEAGDVDARVRVRMREVEQSLALVRQILAHMPPGPVAITPPAVDGEGVALVEGFRGDVLAWARMEGGMVARAHLRDPSWFQWPLLEAAIDGAIVADFPLCNKSFNCAYAGCDL